MNRSSFSPFQLLLENLDADPVSATEKYEHLREKLVQMFKWKGSFDADADSLADEVLDRVAGKLAGGEMIENINAYSISVLRFVWLEHTRKRREIGSEELPETATYLDTDTIDGPDLRIRCLRRCLVEIDNVGSERELILGYYGDSDTMRNKELRRELAEKLGLTVNALKIKACRLRAKLEKCINECVARETKPPSKDTIDRGSAREANF